MSNTTSPTPERPVEPGHVTDWRMRPAGVMPRHLQQWALLGIAIVMVGIMALSGSSTKPRATAGSSPATSAVDPDQHRIEDYQRRIQEQTQRLAAEQAQLQLTKDAVASTTADATGSGQSRPQLNRRPPSATAPERGTREDRTPGEDRVTREEHPRVADNVAFSRPSVVPASAVPTPGALSSVLVTASPTSVALPSAAAPVTEPPTATHTATPLAPDRGSPATTGDQTRYQLREGTLIETVLTNRLDGTFTGPVNCLVSVPVYASDQQHLVIPAGSRVLGEARAVNTFGQSRLAVVFHRVILPNGTHLDLNGFHGLNQVGDLGLQDQVDRHYAQIFGVSLAIGAIAGFAQAQSAAGLDATALDAYRQGVAANVSQSSARILDRFLNILPTVTIREGHRIKVYLSNDLELPAYREALPVTGGRP
jgi:type IV secretory pathway VirB10-like protein